MATDREVVEEIEHDGYCPFCYALDDQACVDFQGRATRDHRSRHPMPTSNAPSEAADA